jgi:prepilin-type N-terminal cleavage/methylation domain-containing protein
VDYLSYSGFNVQKFQIFLAFLSNLYKNYNMNPKMTQLCSIPRSPKALKPFSSLNKKSSIMGFTLIELLVVIGILGIIVIMVVQAISDSKSTSTESQIRGSLRSLNTAQTRAVLVGDLGRPNAVDSVWVNTPENAVQWYIDNGYVTLPEFDENVLNYIEIRPLTPAEMSAGLDPVNIWKRKP